MKASQFAWIGVCLLTAAAVCRAQQTAAATPPGGYFKLTARGHSDSVLSLPLVQRSALLARVAAVGAGSVTLAADGVPNGVFAPGNGAGFELQFVSGALEGLCYRVVGNTGPVITLATGGDDLTAHALGAVAVGASGDLVRIRPCWSIAGVLGADEGSLRLDPVAELPAGPYLGADAVLLPANGSAGTEKNPRLAVVYVAGTGWRAVGDGGTDQGAQALAPGEPFTVRRQRAEPAEVVLVGYVMQERFVLRVPALAAGDDFDFAVALAHPVELTLADSGLIAAAAPSGAVEASPDALSVRDALLEFDSGRSGLALPAARRFYVLGTGWLESDAPADAHALQPGSGCLLRLRGGRPVRYWVQPRPE